MKFDIVTTPTFMFSLTQAQLDVLKQLAALHYDATCKATLSKASSDGSKNGLLTIWQTNLEYDIPLSATFRELDLILKILEAGSFVGGDLAKETSRLNYAFNDMLNQYQRLAPNWRAASLETRSFRDV